MLLGYRFINKEIFGYETITPYGGTFQFLHLTSPKKTFLYSLTVHFFFPFGISKVCLPHQPFFTKIVLKFRLFPFRSPLLRESFLLSFPLGTKMFQFPRFALFLLIDSVISCRVSSFGYLWIKICFQLPKVFRR